MKISFANGSLATWLTRAVTALRNRNRVQITHTVFPMQNAPQITSGWDYRPRSAVRQTAAFDCRGQTAAVVGASTPKENDDTWFNFTNPEPTAEQAPITAPLSGDAHKV
jgi:hypothetical protein